MIRGAAQVVRALAAATALVGLVAGVPLALWLAVGWPLPTALPGGDELARSVGRGGIDTATFLKALACVVWLAWAQLAVAAVAEAVATMRGSVARPLPGVPAGVQVGVGRLVATVALLGSIWAPRTAAAADLGGSAQPPPITMAAEEPAPVLAPDPAAGSVSIPEATWTVARRDTLSGIAARSLGDAERWPEIYKANRDRPQPNGRSLSDPGRLEPGWLLVLPDGAVVPDGGGSATGAVAAGGTGAHRVVPGESLSAIAGARLGDEARWGELYEANRGRPQPDGGELDVPDLIRPGWLLELPGAAAAQAESSRAPEAPPASAPEAATPPPPGADAVLGAVPGEEAPDASASAPPTTFDLPASGEEEVPPGSSAPALPAPASPTSGSREDTVPENIAPSTAVPVIGDPVEEPAPGDDWPGPGALLAGGLATAGVVVLLNRLRRVQQRHRHRGERVQLPGPDGARTEVHLRAGADLDGAARLDLALRTLANAEVTLPAVTSVRLRRGTIEVHLAMAAQPPAGWEEGDDRTWVLPVSVPDEVLDAAAFGSVSPLPALVSLGTDGDAEVLVDLEAACIVAVTGDGAAGVVRGLALSVATSPWADDVELVLVGLEAPPGLGWVRQLGSVGEALDLAEARSTATTRALRLTGAATTVAGRLSGRIPDAWEPTVVAVAAPLGPGDLDRLAALAVAPWPGVAVVVVGEVAGAPWQCHLAGPADLEVDVLGLRLRPHRLDEETGAALHQVLAAAADTQSWRSAAAVDDDAVDDDVVDDDAVDDDAVDDDAVDDDAESDETDVLSAGPSLIVVSPAEQVSPNGSVEAVPGDSGPIDSVPSDAVGAGTAPGEMVPAEVVVRLLGEVDVRRADGEVLEAHRSKSTEAMAYLALHPEGVTAEALQAALWPAGTNAKATLHATMSILRRILGTTGAGEAYLPPAADTGGLYRLHWSVTTDYHQLRLLARSAADAPPALAEPLLARGLDLVRGEAFGTRARSAYAWCHGWAATVESAVVESAEALAEIRLAGGDPRGAERAARQGLAASPYHEGLYRLLMRAADALGHPAGVRAVLKELAAKLELEIEPHDVLHPETAALFDELTSKHRASA